MHATFKQLVVTPVLALSNLYIDFVMQAGMNRDRWPPSNLYYHANGNGQGSVAWTEYVF